MSRSTLNHPLPILFIKSDLIFLALFTTFLASGKEVTLLIYSILKKKLWLKMFERNLRIARCSKTVLCQFAAHFCHVFRRFYTKVKSSVCIEKIMCHWTDHRAKKIL